MDHLHGTSLESGLAIAWGSQDDALMNTNIIPNAAIASGLMQHGQYKSEMY